MPQLDLGCTQFMNGTQAEVVIAIT